MHNLSKVTRRSGRLTRDADRPAAAIGENPFDAPGTAWPPIGRAAPEDRKAQEPIKGIGNASGANIVPGLAVAETTDSIKNWRKP